MLPLPRLAPQTGLRFRIRLARDYHVRVDGNDYSVDPRHIGRNIDAVASADCLALGLMETLIVLKG
ncbi:Mu transposase domain-containing protein [Plantibacter sp. RU18]|uniref:Mu transposase domain-containing protein n=1 Tax=Plantibacter sp. RU18 TaxID=3158143 RepID=UPI003D359F11